MEGNGVIWRFSSIIHLVEGLGGVGFFRGGGVVVLVFGFGFVVSGLFWFLREVFFFL